MCPSHQKASCPKSQQQHMPGETTGMHTSAPVLQSQKQLLSLSHSQQQAPTQANKQRSALNLLFTPRNLLPAHGQLHLCSPENRTSIENVQIARGQLAWGNLGGNCKRSSELSSEGKGDSVPKTLQRASGGFLNRPLPRRPSTGL